MGPCRNPQAANEAGSFYLTQSTVQSPRRPGGNSVVGSPRPAAAASVDWEDEVEDLLNWTEGIGAGSPGFGSTGGLF